MSGHLVDASDEGRHPAGPEPLWNESHYLDFVGEDGSLGGYLRIGLYPNLGVTWWTAMVVGDDRPVVASVAYDLPVADGSGLEFATAGYELATTVERPLETVRVRGSVPAESHADPAAIYAEEKGAPTRIGFDLEWRTDGSPYHYELTTRYEVPCVVEGELVLGDEKLAIRGPGQRDHSWGVRDWWAFGWCWASARMEDGTRVHLTDVRIPGSPVAFGYLQDPGGAVRSVTTAVVREDLGPFGMPTAARARLEPPGLELEVEPVAFGPLLLVAPDGRTSRFPRALARFADGDGRRGIGWIEWNQPGDAAG